MAFRRYRTSRQPHSTVRRMFDWLFTALVFAVLVLVIVRLEEFSAKKHVGVPQIADGDTLVYSGNRVRLEGIDAPEFNQTCVGPGGSYPCGRLARSALDMLISKRATECTGWQLDKYERLLVRCSVAGTDINREMVRQGWAVAYGDYGADEADARAAKRGVWQGDFQRPSAFRKMKGDLVEPGETPHDVWFKIKAFVAALFAWSGV